MIRLKRSLLLHHHHRRATIGEIHEALQSAIELEHSTIPLYLYALYSLDRTVNGEIVKILRSAVIEEMLHMCLAANVLNALGGTPKISGPTFTPSYPGHLPGGVEGQIEVHLAPFSMEQLTVFIEIEEPRDPLAIPEQSGPDEIGDCTIGEFYLSIEKAILALDDVAFVGDHSRQVGPDLMWGSVTVTDKASAINAINTIIEQGEGTTTSPEESPNEPEHGDFAHYYRFMQIHQGRRLVRAGESATSAANYQYQGESVTFDPDGVAPLPVDPRAAHYANGTAERELVDEFNATYTELLGCLERLFTDSANNETFGVALGLMGRLETAARQMVETSLGSTVTVGPTFEFLER